MIRNIVWHPYAILVRRYRSHKNKSITNKKMAYDENRGQGFQRQMYQGDWKCADCGKEISELPFQPDPSRVDQLRCKDCYKPKRPFRRDR